MHSSNTATNLAILGSTGSIGKNAFKILASSQQHFNLIALTCNTNAQDIYNQCLIVRPKIVIINSVTQEYHWIKKFESIGVKAYFGLDELTILSQINIECVVIALSGFNAIHSIKQIAKNASVKKVCLANKESIVCLGSILLDDFKNRGVEVVPVDSEHNSAFQIMQHCINNRDINQLILTASGGAVFNKTYQELTNITPADVLKHPNWQMGGKITIDSSTMANKGLELIEACRLFNLNQQQIEVAINTKSVVHAIVRFSNLSLVSFSSVPNMALHIAHAMFYPANIPQNLCESFFEKVDIYNANNFALHPVDLQKYPMLQIARHVCHSNFLSLAYNHINEILVEKFIAGNLAFMQIAVETDRNLMKLSNETFEIDSFEAAFEAVKLINKKCF